MKELLFDVDVILKSIAPAVSCPSLTKRIGAESTTLLSIVITMTTRKTVKMPIRNADFFLVVSEHR